RRQVFGHTITISRPPPPHHPPTPTRHRPAPPRPGPCGGWWLSWRSCFRHPLVTARYLRDLVCLVVSGGWSRGQARLELVEARSRSSCGFSSGGCRVAVFAAVLLVCYGGFAPVEFGAEVGCVGRQGGDEGAGAGEGEHRHAVRDQGLSWAVGSCDEGGAHAGGVAEDGGGGVECGVAYGELLPEEGPAGDGGVEAGVEVAGAFSVPAEDDLLAPQDARAGSEVEPYGHAVGATGGQHGR